MKIGNQSIVLYIGKSCSAQNTSTNIWFVEVNCSLCYFIFSIILTKIINETIFLKKGSFFREIKEKF